MSRFNYEIAARNAECMGYKIVPIEGKFRVFTDNSESLWLGDFPTKKAALLFVETLPASDLLEVSYV